MSTLVGGLASVGLFGFAVFAERIGTMRLHRVSLALGMASVLALAFHSPERLWQNSVPAVAVLGIAYFAWTSAVLPAMTGRLWALAALWMGWPSLVLYPLALILAAAYLRVRTGRSFLRHAGRTLTLIRFGVFYSQAPDPKGKTVPFGVFMLVSCVLTSLWIAL